MDVCLAAERLLNDGLVVSAADVLTAVSDGLSRHTDGDLAVLVPVSASKFVSSLPKVRSDVTLDGYVSGGGLVRDLRAAYLASEGSDGSDIALRLAAAAEAGLDGARLLDALAVFEAHRHVNLIWHQAHRYAPRLRREPEDLFGWGWHGLKVALTRYDPTRNAFSTYACACIVSKIRDGVRAEMPVVKKMLTLRNKVSDAEQRLVVTLGRMPTLQEVADDLGEDVARLRLLQVQLAIADTSSVDELSSSSDGDAYTPGWLADDGPSPEDLAVLSDRRDRVRAAVSNLSADDALLVELLVFEQVPLRVACERLGMTQRQLRTARDRVFALLADGLSDLSSEYVPDEMAAPQAAPAPPMGEMISA